MYTYTYHQNQLHASHPFGGKRSKRLVAYCTILSILLTPITASTAYAAISDVPLYLSSPVEPNLMFVLDDSGSMQWDVIPDPAPVLTSVYFTFPRPQTLYGANYAYSTLTGPAGDYNGVARFDPADRYARYFRTSQFNPLYYNPAIRYTPWRNADNSLWINAVPGAALYNPATAGEGNLDLTSDRTSTAVWLNNNGSRTAAAVTYYPATYFSYTGTLPPTDPTDANNIQADFVRVEIKSTTPTYTKVAARTDCSGSTCTYTEEIQNFANWFTYSRSRVLAARAGVGKAFASQGTGMRVGFGAINKDATSIDGVTTETVIRGVRPFSGTDRTAFFTSLYGHTMPSAGTPLRRALNDAGQYFSRTDSAGPWGDTPGSNTGATSAHLQCRQSYTILMTDGYWNTDLAPATTAAARANVDGTAGPGHTGPGSAAFTYTAVSPFTDGNADTLADVAMFYWKNDLRTDLVNSVPISTINPAFWQHMSTFGVGLGVTGSIDPATAFNAISSGATITWPVPTASNAAKLDDLLHAGVNGRGGFFTASNPDVFATELSRVLNSIVDRVSSSSAVASNSTRLTTNTHLYQALFKSSDWAGQLKAFPLLADGTVGTEVWDAANVLPAHGSRNITTRDNSGSAVNFSSALGTLTVAQVNYLRGDASGEVVNGGAFRNRTSKLGDIVNADPHYVKDENFGYNLLAGAEGSSYSTFLAGKSSRTAMVYAGANDGMLHGFQASDGVEQFAYVPNGVWLNLPLLTSPSYSHKYFVDGSPTAWDAYWGSSWKSVLAGSLGAGGKSVYLLNVSTPGTFGTSDALWEFKGNTTAQQSDMGFVMGTVTVARFADGNYWAVFGNGYESTNGRAVLFMVRVDSPTTVKTIDVGGTSNGLSTPLLVDTNGDRIIDLIYAGDLNGNAWKFDVAGSTPTTWKSDYLSGATPVPLFQAKDSGGITQPITSLPEVGLAPTGASGFMVYFGTGKYFETGDNSTVGTQSVYGVVDSGSAFTGTNHRTQLQSQTIQFEATMAATVIPAVVVGGVTTVPAISVPEKRVRALSDNSVNYPTQKGWVIDLLTPPNPPGTQRGERMITAPALFGGKLLLQSIVPSTSPCDYGGASWFMQVNPATGGRLQAAGFDVNGDGSFNSSDQVDIGGGVMVNVSGLDTGVGISGGFGKPIKAGDRAYVPLSGTSGKIGAPPISSGTLKSRASWRQIQ